MQPLSIAIVVDDALYIEQLRRCQVAARKVYELYRRRLSYIARGLRRRQWVRRGRTRPRFLRAMEGLK